MEALSLGGSPSSDLALTLSQSRKPVTYSGSMLTPSEIEFLRLDKAASLDRFAELQRQDQEQKAAILPS